MSKYAKVVEKLIKTARNHGYEISHIDEDGQNRYVQGKLTDEQLIFDITEKDQSFIQFTNGQTGFACLLIFGNAFYETIADHTDTPDAHTIADETSRAFRYAH